MNDRAPPGPSAFELEFELWERVEYLDASDKTWKVADIFELHHNPYGVTDFVTMRLQKFEPFSETYHDVYFPFRSIRIPAEQYPGENRHDDLMVDNRYTDPCAGLLTNCQSTKSNKYFI